MTDKELSKTELKALEKQKQKQEIAERYMEFVRDNGKLPTASDLIKFGYNRDVIRAQYGNYTNLYEHVGELYPDVVSSNLTTAESVLNPANRRRVEEKFAKHSRFVITTAVAGKKVHPGMLESINNFNAHNDSMTILIPCSDVADSLNGRNQVNDIVTYARELRDEYFVNDEVALNSNLFISNIKVSAKQIKPTTGLTRIGQSQGSYIFASPKQFLEYVATSPNSDYSKAIMTTGAITVNDYSNDLYMSQRTSYIASHDHVYGGIIVEVEDDRIFHFRHFQCAEDGSFADLGYRYHPDGRVTKEKVHLYSGDLHVGQTDTVAFGATLTLCEEVGVSDFIVGDFFDGYSISHHHMNRPLKLAKKSMDRMTSLMDEINLGGQYANTILESIKGNLVMVKGNHDEFLYRYLESGNYTKDYENMYLALELAKDMLEGNDPLKVAYERYGNIEDFERIIWLSRDQSFPIGGVECGQHGDLGANGSRASLASLEKSYGRCIVGHNHGGAIMRNVFRVGTLTELILDYNRGPSSWTHTSALVYEDGSVQLINVIEGACHNSKFLNTINSIAGIESDGKEHIQVEVQ